MANKGFVLAQRPQAGKTDYLRNGEHLVLFDNIDDCFEKIRYYLVHQDEARAIAEAGFEHIKANLRFDVYLPKIVEEIGKLI